MMVSESSGDRLDFVRFIQQPVGILGQGLIFEAVSLSLGII
ncbi:MAG TPA: hypothetical protein V6D26_01875 [Stenomitos sp.]